MFHILDEVGKSLVEMFGSHIAVLASQLKHLRKGLSDGKIAKAL